LRNLTPALGEYPRIAHAVVLPDVTVTGPLGTYPREIIIDATDLIEPSRCIETVLRHWGNLNSSKIGRKDVDRISETLAPTVTLRRRLLTDVAEAVCDLINLTIAQMRTMQMLRSIRRCVVRGGAGTGKTLLAVEKARQLGRDGGRVLWVCFNAPLAN